MFCHLCGRYPAIENSHVIPKFVVRALKGDAPTMGMRSARRPNVSIQDVERYKLLCQACETRFSIPENHAATAIFHPFRSGETNFTYGPDLHYFAASLFWRTLAVRLPKIESKSLFPRPVIEELAISLRNLQRHLLKPEATDQLKQHLYFWDSYDEVPPDLARFGVGTMARHTAHQDILVNRAGRAWRSYTITPVASMSCTFRGTHSTIGKARNSNRKAADSLCHRRP